MIPFRFGRPADFALLCCATVWLSVPLSLSADVIYPELPPGSRYQLIFVTSGGRDATSTNIADYNAFVTAQAALNPTFPAGVTWSAVASTASVAARDNAVNPAGIPVFNTAGVLVCSATSNLYAHPLLAAPKYDQFGDLRYAGVWTGSLIDGTVGAPLGGGGGDLVTFGLNTNPESWLVGTTVADRTAGMGFYGLSSPITVPAPEPSTLALLGGGLVAMMAVKLRRAWRRPAIGDAARGLPVARE